MNTYEMEGAHSRLGFQKNVTRILQSVDLSLKNVELSGCVTFNLPEQGDHLGLSKVDYSFWGGFIPGKCSPFLQDKSIIAQ